MSTLPPELAVHQALYAVYHSPHFLEGKLEFEEVKWFSAVSQVGEWWSQDKTLCFFPLSGLPQHPFLGQRALRRALSAQVPPRNLIPFPI